LKTLKNQLNQESWIAIGDIHASKGPLIEVLDKCETYDSHSLVFLGDYVDYGQELEDTLQILKNMKRKSIFLLGNHDEELLSVWRKFKHDSEKKEKILAYYKITEDSISWMENNLRLSFETESAFFSHAGLNDLKALNEQSKEDLIMSGFREELDHVTPKLVIQGHLVRKRVENFGNHWFVDTGCGWGGCLSALVYPEMKVLQSVL